MQGAHNRKKSKKGAASGIRVTKDCPKTRASAANPFPPLKRAGFCVILAGSALLASASLLLKSKEGDPVSPALPRSYALCSRNGPAIYTIDETNSIVECLLVHGSNILDTGSLDEVLTKWNQKHYNIYSEGMQTAYETPLQVKLIPLNSVVIPGMSDSHGHTLEYGSSRILPLEGSRNSAAVVARVRDFILSNPDILNDTTRLIEGWGWDHTAWPVEEFPSFKELETDPIVQGRPVVLQSKDGHALWVSETTLKLMLPLPEEVDGGIIMLDEKGNPTGVFLDKAQDLVKRPPLTDADRLQRFNIAVNDALSKGLTSFHDAGFDPESLSFFKRQAELDKLPVRIYGMTYFDEKAEYWGDKRTKVINENRLTARSVKIFADGALRSGGAALFEPYTDNPETSGFMRIDPEVLYKFVPKFLTDGWQVNIHAIGDRANSIILDVLESALENELKGVNGTAVRPRIEHAQIIRPEDTIRLAKLGVIASVQPTHVVSDMWYAQDRLGPERIKNLYAFRTIIDAGARITLGSDFPVEDMNPLAGFHAAITRVASDNTSPHGPGGWFPEQRLTRIEALRGITIDPAYASFSEEDLGSLEPGKLADYVVISQDIMTVPADKILDTRVLATVIDGQLAFGHV
ncbi:hypothetical protein M0805_006395 [Coniferiporia weirii]|nr:hypothetical protein M0805_006395 [Coniferiporia weirii]